MLSHSLRFSCLQSPATLPAVKDMEGRMGVLPGNSLSTTEETVSLSLNTLNVESSVFQISVALRYFLLRKE